MALAGYEDPWVHMQGLSRSSMKDMNADGHDDGDPDQ